MSRAEKFPVNSEVVVMDPAHSLDGAHGVVVSHESEHQINAKFVDGIVRTLDVSILREYHPTEDAPSQAPQESESRFSGFVSDIKDSFAWKAAPYVLTVWAVAAMMVFDHGKRAPEPVAATWAVQEVRSEVMVATQELNALNLEKVPLVESCAKLKEVNAKIQIRTKIISDSSNPK